MRWRFGERRSNPFTCCFCCHVRLGTVLIGAFYLLIDLLVITLALILAFHPELYQYDSEGAHLTTGYSDMVTNRMENTTSHYLNTTNWMTWNTLNCDDRFVGIMLTTGSAMLTVCMLYGTIKGYPKYLLPFFCLQVFDFCVTSLSVIGYFSYEPSVKLWIADQKWLPIRSQLLSVDSSWLMLLAALLSVTVLWLKAYCISVVWTCYKYLSQSHFNLSNIGQAPTYDVELMNIDDANSAYPNAPITSGVEFMVLPPKYEDVLEMSEQGDDSLAAGAPPPYSSTDKTDG